MIRCIILQSRGLKKPSSEIRSIEFKTDRAKASSLWFKRVNFSRSL